MVGGIAWVVEGNELDLGPHQVDHIAALDLSIGAEGIGPALSRLASNLDSEPLQLNLGQTSHDWLQE